MVRSTAQGSRSDVRPEGRGGEGIKIKITTEGKGDTDPRGRSYRRNRHCFTEFLRERSKQEFWSRRIPPKTAKNPVNPSTFRQIKHLQKSNQVIDPSASRHVLNTQLSTMDLVGSRELQVSTIHPSNFLKNAMAYSLHSVFCLQDLHLHDPGRATLRVLRRRPAFHSEEWRPGRSEPGRLLLFDGFVAGYCKLLVLSASQFLRPFPA